MFARPAIQTNYLHGTKVLAGRQSFADALKGIKPAIAVSRSPSPDDCLISARDPFQAQSS